jgi:hypothetical protein
MEDRAEYRCDVCNKYYASYKSRWLHIKKYHNNNVVKCSINVVDDIKNCSSKSSNKTLQKKIDCNTCKYCNKQLCDRMYRWKHEQKCKLSININSTEIYEIKKQNEKLEKQIEELKELVQKSMKIHPKTLQKINNQLNMNNNGIINNNFIIQLGYEDFNKVLSENEKIGLLNKHSNSVIEMVKMVHVNPNKKYKQYKSMYITNLQNNVAYKYDDTCKKFIAVSKMDLLDSIIDNRIADIENFHEDYKDKITPFTSNHIQKFLDKISNEKDYKDVKKEELKFAIYNGREEIINQIKENNPDLNIFI